MPMIEADSERIVAASNEVTRSTDAVATEVSGMLRNLYALQDTWRGSAASNFQSVIDEWRGVQERVAESLSGIRDALAVAGKQYDEVEAANTKLFLP